MKISGIYQIKPSKETLDKRSKSLKGKRAWNKGISPSNESRLKQSNALKNKSWEELYGIEGAAKRRTKEYRDKISKNCSGIPSNKKGKTWEEIYGVEGAAKRRNKNKGAV